MRRWFLPDNVNLLGLLDNQAGITEEGIVALCAWANGDISQESEVRAAEHRADEARRVFLRQLRTAFATPVDAEDLFVLSEALDEVMNGAKDLVREATILGIATDDSIADMGESTLEAVRHLRGAFAHLSGDADLATTEADAAIKCAREIEHQYRRSMSALLESDDLREVIARRELYRRGSDVADQIRRVAERIWYTVVKSG